MLKPVALIVLSFAGSAAAAGLSLGGGVPGVGRDDPRRDRDLRARGVRAVGADVPARRRRRERLHGDRASQRRAPSRRSMTEAARCETRAALRNLSGRPGSGGSGGGPRRRQIRRRRGRRRPACAAVLRPPAEGAPARAEGPADGTLPLGGETIGAGSVGAAGGSERSAQHRASRRSDQELGETSPGSEPGAGRDAETAPPLRRRAPAARSGVAAEHG